MIDDKTPKETIGHFPDRKALFLCMWDNTLTEIHSRKTLWEKYKDTNLFIGNGRFGKTSEMYGRAFDAWAKNRIVDGDSSEEDFEFEWYLANAFGNPSPQIQFRFLDEVMDFLSLDTGQSPHGMPSQWTLTYFFRNDNMTIRRIA